MDLISATVFSIQNPLLRLIGVFLDSPIAYAILIAALLFFNENRNDKRQKLIASLLVAFVLATMIKFTLLRDRPCIGQIDCPGDFAFPSMHATIAFTLMTGFLNKKIFPLFVVFALFVSFTRINLGVHSFYDIAGALPVALVSYYIVDILWKRRKDGS